MLDFEEANFGLGGYMPNSEAKREAGVEGKEGEWGLFGLRLFPVGLRVTESSSSSSSVPRLQVHSAPLGPHPHPHPVFSGWLGRRQ